MIKLIVDFIEWFSIYNIAINKSGFKNGKDISICTKKEDSNINLTIKKVKKFKLSIEQNMVDFDLETSNNTQTGVIKTNNRIRKDISLF